MIWASVFTAPFGLIARAFQVSEFIIGLTVIAIGTSLPEIAATIVASLRGEVEIAVGNVIGSNIFNILLLLGLTSAVTPQGLQVTQEALRFDIPLLVAVSFACLPLMANGLRVSRLDGAVLLGYYVLYVGYLYLHPQHHRHIEPFSDLLLYGLILLASLMLIAGLMKRISLVPIRTPG